MAPRAKWDKLLPAFNFVNWSKVGQRRDLAEREFPVLAAYYQNTSGEFLPAHVIQELLEVEANETDEAISGKFVALKTHIKIADSANCLRLAKELLMLSGDNESPAVFVAQFVGDLLAKPARP